MLNRLVFFKLKLSNQNIMSIVVINKYFAPIYEKKKSYVHLWDIFNIGEKFYNRYYFDI